MPRLSKRAKQRLERENSHWLYSSVSKNLHARTKDLVKYNKDIDKDPKTISALMVTATEIYLEATKFDQSEHPLIDSKADGKTVIRFRVTSKFYNVLMERIEKNSADYSGPRSLSDLTSLALSMYVKEEEELIKYLEDHPEHSDGFTLPGE